MSRRNILQGRIKVTVNGRSFELPRPTEVRQALYAAAGDASLVRRVERGEAVVWEEVTDCEVDLGGALFDGARLLVRDLGTGHPPGQPPGRV